jgi:hypothetical protein
MEMSIRGRWNGAGVTGGLLRGSGRSQTRATHGPTAKLPKHTSVDLLATPPQELNDADMASISKSGST